MTMLITGMMIGCALGVLLTAICVIARSPDE